MKIFLADGRLGNQIFQYVFLKSKIKGNERIIASGFEELKEAFEIDGVINLNKKNKWIKCFVFKVIKTTLMLLCGKKVISSINIAHEKVLDKYRRETASYSTEVGFLKNIVFVKPGFFQSENFFKKSAAEDLVIKQKYINKAVTFLKCIPNEYHKIFIHIRRGDYKDYTVYGKSALLPLTYFKKQIQWFLDNRQNCFFVFLSDEADFIQEEFKYIEDKLISSDNHFGTDLAIMTLCKSAILSPSSFGWWGSYLMAERDTVFVPKYWLGFNSKTEYQANATPSFSNEIQI